MRMVDWLTYAGIDQLKQLHGYYGCGSANYHSKHDLICSLLRQINKKNYVNELLKKLSPQELRFLESIVLDQSPSYTMEELMAKGRAALAGNQGEPRKFVVEALKKGWLFPGYSQHTQYLYHMPSDTREQIQQALIEPYLVHRIEECPSWYRDEEHQLVQDLYRFLQCLERDLVRLTQDLSIYKQQQKQILRSMSIVEEPLEGQGPRFGFGRMYHLYPDRFSLIYDYAYYEKYVVEENGLLSLTTLGAGKCNKNDRHEAKQIYRFWIRLYRRPIPHLPLILRWISLLAYPHWMPVYAIYQAIGSWLTPYYYENEMDLFRRIMNMLVHLGVGKWGQEGEQHLFTLTSSGVKWMKGISAFREKTIEEGFIR